jgi:hypothetical protein
LTTNAALVPVVSFSSGGFGDVRTAVEIANNRRYSVIEFKAGFAWHFGKAH